MDFAVLNNTSSRLMCPREHFFLNKSYKVIGGMVKQTLEDTISKKFFCFPTYS